MLLKIDINQLKDLRPTEKMLKGNWEIYIWQKKICAKHKDQEKIFSYPIIDGFLYLYDGSNISAYIRERKFQNRLDLLEINKVEKNKVNQTFFEDNIYKIYMSDGNIDRTVSPTQVTNATFVIFDKVTKNRIIRTLIIENDFNIVWNKIIQTRETFLKKKLVDSKDKIANLEEEIKTLIMNLYSGKNIPDKENYDFLYKGKVLEFYKALDIRKQKSKQVPLLLASKKIKVFSEYEDRNLMPVILKMKELINKENSLKDIHNELNKDTLD